MRSSPRHKLSRANRVAAATRTRYCTIAEREEAAEEEEQRDP